MMADTHIGPHALDKAAPSLAIDAAVSAFVLRSSGDVLPPESIAHLHKAAKLLATLLPHIAGRRDREQIPCSFGPPLGRDRCPSAILDT